jgi:hypothetical protein
VATSVVEVLTMSDTLTATVHAADQYRKMAADCREQSERAPNSHHKENWLKIAGQWQNLAETAETYRKSGGSS